MKKVHIYKIMSLDQSKEGAMIRCVDRAKYHGTILLVPMAHMRPARFSINVTPSITNSRLLILLNSTRVSFAWLGPRNHRTQQGAMEWTQMTPTLTRSSTKDTLYSVRNLRPYRRVLEGLSTAAGYSPSPSSSFVVEYTHSSQAQNLL